VPFFTAIHKAQPGWRRVVAQSTLWGIPMPAFTTALSFFDGYRSEIVPANLLQAQRDYFGAHTFLVLPGKENERFVSGENIRAFLFTSSCGLAINRPTLCRSPNRHQLDRTWWKCLGGKLRCVEQLDVPNWIHGKMNRRCGT